MKRVALVCTAAALAGAVAITRYWYASPDAYPTFLRRMGNWVIDAMNTESAEASADLERLYVFGSALLPCLLLAWAAHAAWARWRGRRDQPPLR